ncbi:MAG: hypothetical protein WAO83_01425, partial [Fuerstiella sp.]
VVGSAYVGYSYNSTDGESCLVCPMTGQPVFGSTDSAGPGCCSGGAAATLTGVDGAAPTCCGQSKTGSCSEVADAVLTSTDAAECHGDCDKACCQDKKDTVDVAVSQDEVVAEDTTEAVSEVTETE